MVPCALMRMIFHPGPVQSSVTICAMKQPLTAVCTKMLAVVLFFFFFNVCFPHCGNICYGFRLSDRDIGLSVVLE